jgi:hypothetical protein
MNRRLVLMALVAAAVACGSCRRSEPSAAADAAVPDDPEADDIREAVIRFQIAGEEPFFERSATVMFVGAGRACHDAPPPAFLKRLTHPKFRFAPADASVMTAIGLLDRKTGERGVNLCAGTIKRTAPDVVEVHGSVTTADLAAHGGTYFVRKVGGTWTVERYEKEWLS